MYSANRLCLSLSLSSFLSSLFISSITYSVDVVVLSRREMMIKRRNAAHAVVTYTRAVQRNLIKGLASYNILQNPSYKEAFGITWKFAVTHKDVRSVRTIKVSSLFVSLLRCNPLILRLLLLLLSLSLSFSFSYSLLIEQS